MGSRHLYIHIPFCPSRCRYCDFASEAIHVGGEYRIERYFRMLHSEIQGFLPELHLPLETVYVGGGTPTAVRRGLLTELLSRISQRSGSAQGAGRGPREEGGALIHPDGELTVEANPGTVDAEYLAELMRAGVTRLSLGVQSFHPELLRSLGRRVEINQLDTAIGAVKDVGWLDWNLDLVFGIPGQDRDSMHRDIYSAVQARPTHISLYDLTYTRGYLDYLDQEIQVPFRDAQQFAEDHYAEAADLLQDAGYLRYEISNFALPGYESKHNQAYWRGRDYAGVGVAAVSTLGGERRTNPDTVDEYLRRRPATLESLSPPLRLEEMGYLTHPHTSAGRIPTDRGYRHFVDGILRRRFTVKTPSLPLKPESLATEVDSALQQTSEVMSQATNLLALVAGPRLTGAHLRHIELLALQPNLITVVFIASTGHVTKQVIESPVSVDTGTLDWARTYVNEMTEGQAITERLVRKVAENPDLSRAEREFLDLLGPAFERLVDEHAAEALYVGGASRLLSKSQLEDMMDVSGLLALLEERYILLRILRTALGNDGPVVRIGEEHGESALRGFSVVAVGYGLPERNLGTVVC